MNSDLPERLAERLKRPIPGKRAQRAFAPTLGYGRHHGPAPHDARPAAVTLLLHADEQGEWRLPMTLRSHGMPSHAGQVSFPGGMSEQGESPEETALRELEEELGISRDAVHVLGRLSPLYVWASNFYVTPVLAFTTARPDFTPCASEVAELLDVPLSALEDPQLRGEHPICRRGLVFRAPHLEVCGHRIWGASCMILGELAALL
jgi:8-oxo-dGTP pyrophosphatase MutT (NUDIX family)